MKRPDLANHVLYSSTFRDMELAKRLVVVELLVLKVSQQVFRILPDAAREGETVLTQMEVRDE